MDMVIVKFALDNRYENNATCIFFSIQDTVINAIIEVSNLIILATFLLSGKLLILSATLLNGYNDMIILFFNKRIGLKFSQATLSNYPVRGGQNPASYPQFGFVLNL